ncbi:sensor histidine kinase [Parasulfitobacter algicola]|uniref:histidine kinase n=1 Tax=Parasulfitobacter algicola TaxID=2614809 RepID=A0ABX2IUH5_9RHOB|nr:HAMP domain-containing sensor histidine kinase [Sulfitobacter algicola]NSX55661.1 HAMP domain-containing histidine kinase [Sulfitobacter algicola]
MHVLTKLRILVSLMVLTLLCSVTLAVWSINQANRHIQRIDLAHTVYQNYLSLYAHTYELFKQYGDDLLIGTDTNLIDHQVTEIRTDIADIRQAIGAEIDLVGSEEIEELQALNTIEVRLNRLIFVLSEMSESDAPQSWMQLSQVLDAEIDMNFQELIDAALEEESKELIETRAEVAQQLFFYRSLAGIFALIAIVITIATVVLLSNALSRPLARLMSGARKIGEGDYTHRIESTGQDEIAEVAHGINTLAERVQRTTSDLSNQNVQLEKAVKQRTLQLEQLLKEAQEADSLRRSMLSDVSHELRTPLTIIQGEADVALRGAEKTKDEYRDALTRARNAAVHTTRIVDDLLFIARTQAGQPKLKREQVNLLDLVADTLSTFGPNVTFETVLQKAETSLDPVRLRQCLLVLLQNATNYGGDQVICRLDDSPDGYCITIEDDGPGMTEIEKKQAFERYFRGSNASKAYVGGMGLGLPLAKSIIEAHGGQIRLSDREGGGLVASMILPARPHLVAVS